MIKVIKVCETCDIIAHQLMFQESHMCQENEQSNCKLPRCALSVSKNVWARQVQHIITWHISMGTFSNSSSQQLDKHERLFEIESGNIQSYCRWEDLLAMLTTCTMLILVDHCQMLESVQPGSKYWFCTILSEQESKQSADDKDFKLCKIEQEEKGRVPKLGIRLEVCLYIKPLCGLLLSRSLYTHILTTSWDSLTQARSHTLGVYQGCSCTRRQSCCIRNPWLKPLFRKQYRNCTEIPEGEHRMLKVFLPPAMPSLSYESFTMWGHVGKDHCRSGHERQVCRGLEAGTNMTTPWLKTWRSS